MKISYFEKKLSHCWSQKHILKFEISEKVVAGNSKMPSTITVFKNLTDFHATNWICKWEIIFLLITDEYIWNKWIGGWQVYTKHLEIEK